jgi:uncharacterized protein (DUF58 family)
VRPVRDAIVRRRARSSNRGEPAGPRAYAPHDSARTIDWRASASRGEILVRDRPPGAFISWSAIIDDSPSMRIGSARRPLDDAEDAAGLWHECRAGQDAWHGTWRTANAPLHETLHAALRTLPAHCALLCVSDFYGLQEMRPVLRRLATRLDCTALVTGDPWMYRLPGYGVLRAADAETGRTIRAYAGPRQHRDYAKAAAAREAEAERVLRACGWRSALLNGRGAAHALLHAFGLR